jgi:hypothetical protein
MKISRWDIEYSSVVTAHIPKGDGTFITEDVKMIPDDVSCDYIENKLKEMGYEIE